MTLQRLSSATRSLSTILRIYTDYQWGNTEAGQYGISRILTTFMVCLGSYEYRAVVSLSTY